MSDARDDLVGKIESIIYESDYCLGCCRGDTASMLAEDIVAEIWEAGK